VSPLSFLLSVTRNSRHAYLSENIRCGATVSGSAYTFSYITLGEAVGWIVGWCLTLEYGIAASGIARGWAGYLAQLLRDLGVNVPFWLDGWVPASQSIVNLSPLSSVIIVSCTIILILGAKESSRFNVVMTIFNVTLIVFIIILGAYYVEKQNYIPFFPNGVNGVLTGTYAVMNHKK